MKSAQSTSRFWEFVSKQQRVASGRRTHPDAWALDDGLDELLHWFESDEAPDDSLIVRFRCRCRNRRKTYGHRNRLLRQQYDSQYHGGRHWDPLDRLIQQERLEWVKQNTNDSEFHLLCELACGKSYHDLSIELDEAVNTLKSRVSRCRSRLKDQLKESWNRDSAS